MKLQKEKVMSYLVTLCFVSFLLFFLSSLVFLSRVVLDDPQLSNYVSSTQDLLKELDGMQQELMLNESEQIKYIQISDIEDAYVQSTQNKSFLSFRINKELNKYNNSIYFKPELNELERGQKVLLTTGEKASVLRIEENNIIIHVENEKTLKQTQLQEIRGVIIYETD